MKSSRLRTESCSCNLRSSLSVQLHFSLCSLQRHWRQLALDFVNLRRVSTASDAAAGGADMRRWKARENVSYDRLLVAASNSSVCCSEV